MQEAAPTAPQQDITTINGSCMSISMDHTPTSDLVHAAGPDTQSHPSAPPAAAASSQTQQQPPPWHEQLTLRGFLVAVCLGVIFCIITIKLNLGSAGMTPSLNVAGGLLSFVLLKAITQLGARLEARHGSICSVGCGKGSDLFSAFTPQENAVVQTMTSACYSMAGYAGFGSYLLAMGYQAYLNTGGVPTGQPGYQAAAVIDPSLQRVYPYLLLIALPGIFALLGLRNLMILQWRLPYPSGAASGMMINSLHMQAQEASAATRKVKLLGFSALGSFLFDLFKWFFQGPDYRCGFASWPTFGTAALQWTFNFDFQQQYIGAGMLVPHIVAWSMMLGAILSWGLMWPLLTAKAGSWYPSGLNSSDMKGMGSYKIWLSVALLLGEGAYMLGKAALLGFHHAQYHYQHRKAGRHKAQSLRPSPTMDTLLPGTAEDSAGCPAAATTTTAAGSSCSSRGNSRHRIADGLGQSRSSAGGVPVGKDAAALVIGDVETVLGTTTGVESEKRVWLYQRRQCSGSAGSATAAAAAAATTAAAGGCSGGSYVCWQTNAGNSAGHGEGCEHVDDDHHTHTDYSVAGIAFKEAKEERAVREAVFRSCQIPWWVGPTGYICCTLLATIFVPLIYTPAKWYMVLLAFLLGPPIAIANSYGAGLTDQDNGANYATLALFLFAAWAGSAGNGVIAGCTLMGIVMVFAVNAAVLMQDFRTAYITQTSPHAMFAAQLLGTGMGVVFAPLAFWMFWQTGMVGVKDGMYPAPFADVSRGIAIIGTEGLTALPRYCGVLSAVFFAAGLLICLLRDLLPPSYGRFVPSPMGMAFSFYIGANNAIDFFVGSLVMLVWEWRRPEAALQLGPLVGAGLIVGDGLWAIPAALLAIGGVAPPICMKFVAGSS